MKKITAIIVISTSILFSGISSANAEGTSNFDKNNQIIGNVLKSAMGGKIVSPESIAKGEISTDKTSQFGISGETLKADTLRFQPGQISNNTGQVQSVKTYVESKIPLHIQQKMSASYSRQKTPHTPYTFSVVLANKEVQAISVRDTPVYVVAKLTNGEEQSQILYPMTSINEKQNSPSDKPKIN